MIDPFAISQPDGAREKDRDNFLFHVENIQSFNFFFPPTSRANAVLLHGLRRNPTSFREFIFAIIIRSKFRHIYSQLGQGECSNLPLAECLIFTDKGTIQPAVEGPGLISFIWISWYLARFIVAQSVAWPYKVGPSIVPDAISFNSSPSNSAPPLIVGLYCLSKRERTKGNSCPFSVSRSRTSSRAKFI